MNWDKPPINWCETIGEFLTDPRRSHGNTPGVCGKMIQISFWLPVKPTTKGYPQRQKKQAPTHPSNQPTNQPDKQTKPNQTKPNQPNKQRSTRKQTNTRKHANTQLLPWFSVALLLKIPMGICSAMLGAGTPRHTESECRGV